MAPSPIRAAPGLALAALLAAGASRGPRPGRAGEGRDLRDRALDPGVVGGRKARPDEVRRLGLVTDELRKALADSVEPVDVAPQAAEIAKQAPLYKCDGCAATIAKTLGADLAVSGYVEKGSNQIFNLTVTIAEAATGKVIRGGRVVIRADTDDTWAHAMRWVVKNRLLTEPLPNRS